MTIYDLSLNVLVSWQAHSLSTAGTNGSNRLMPRRQLLANRTETDACSGNIAKHHHAMLLAQYFEAARVPLCPACSRRDARRAAALTERPEQKDLAMGTILEQCGLCDAHGFLVTAKRAKTKEKKEAENEQEEDEETDRQRRSKHTLVDFSFALALPDRHAETSQLYTRVGDTKEEGQMLMKMSARSGDYALHIRYFSVGIGVDTDKWQVIIRDEKQRRSRHCAILSALRDSLLSPDGALTATMLPHLTGLQGAVVIRTAVGRAPMYSALCDDFVSQLQALAGPTCLVYPFENIATFNALMNALIIYSSPCFPASYEQSHQAIHASTQGETETGRNE
jgi:CRISPR/Cas system-associated protein Cas7 (RAMP superfamily)